MSHMMFLWAIAIILPLFFFFALRGYCIPCSVILSFFFFPLLYALCAFLFFFFVCVCIGWLVLFNHKGSLP